MQLAAGGAVQLAGRDECNGAHCQSVPGEQGAADGLRRLLGAIERLWGKLGDEQEMRTIVRFDRDGRDAVGGQ